ncbi:MAG: hypothetical protein ACI956_001332 [Nonlabens sp.]
MIESLVRQEIISRKEMGRTEVEIRVEIREGMVSSK